MSASIDFPWLRRIELEFEGLEGIGSKTMIATGKHVSESADNYRIVATVFKSIIGIANPTTIMIWNLSPETRASFVRNKTKVRIKAGWEQGPRGKISQCFYGNLLTATHQVQGPDIVTTITALSAFDSLAEARLLRYYEAGVPVTYIVNEIYSYIHGLEDIDMKGIDDERVGERGWCVHDWCKPALDKLGKAHQFSWSINDGKLQVISDKEAFGKSAVVEDPYLISVNPILNGALQYTVGVQWTCTFDPNVMPAYFTEIRSRLQDRQNNVNGTYRVNTVVHYLDCHSPRSFITTGVAHILGKVSG